MSVDLYRRLRIERHIINNIVKYHVTTNIAKTYLMLYYKMCVFKYHFDFNIINVNVTLFVTLSRLNYRTDFDDF